MALLVDLVEHLIEVLVVGPSPRERLRVFQGLDGLHAHELIKRPPREEAARIDYERVEGFDRLDLNTLDLSFRCFFLVTMCSAVLP